MPIELTCTCGVRLRAGDAAVGKLVKCPKCGALIPVPKPTPEAAQPVEVPPPPPPMQMEKPAAPPPGDNVKACPQCGAIVQAAAVICRHCRHSFGRLGGSRKCPECSADNPRESQLCQACGAPLTSAAVGIGRREAAGRRDLGMEAHLRAIAIWSRIGGVLYMLAAVAVLVIGLIGIGVMSGSKRGGGAEAAGAAMGIMVVVAVLIGGIGVLVFLLGHYLAKYSNTARIISGVLTIIGIVCIGCNLIGTVAGLAGGGSRGGAPEGGVLLVTVLVTLAQAAYYCGVAWVLFNSRSSAICTYPYHQLVAQTPSQQPPTYRSIFFWAPFILMVGGCLMGLLAGAMQGFSRGMH